MSTYDPGRDETEDRWGLKDVASVIRPYVPPVSSVDEKNAIDRVHVELMGGASPKRDPNGPYPMQSGRVDADLASLFYRCNPLVNSMIRSNAQQFLQLPLKIMVSERSGMRATQKTTGPVYQLFDWVNPHMTLADLLENWYSWYSLMGESYWAIVDSEPRYQKFSPKAIYPMDPRYVRIAVNPDTNRSGYWYDNGIDDAAWFDDHEVMASKNFDPSSYWRGCVTANAIELDADTERYLKRQTKNFHANAAQLRGTITAADEIGDQELQRLRKELREQYSGDKNAYRILLLEKGMKYEPLPANNADAHAQQVMDTVVDSHAMVFNCPVGLLTGKLAAGVKMVELDAIRWSNLKGLGTKLQQTISKRVCLPLVPDKGFGGARMYAEFDYSVVPALGLQELDKTRRQVASTESGHKTPNEIRDENGMGPYTGEYKEYGDTPVPVWKAKQAADAAAAKVSPSMGLPGSMGGRDQTDSGEAQMVDPTGKRSLPQPVVDKLAAFFDQQG